MTAETVRHRAGWLADYASALALVTAGVALIVRGITWMT
jgi:hypothetical protein